jgi:hypothetical protein
MIAGEESKLAIASLNDAAIAAEKSISPSYISAITLKHGERRGHLALGGHEPACRLHADVLGEL